MNYISNIEMFTVLIVRNRGIIQVKNRKLKRRAAANDHHGHGEVTPARSEPVHLAWSEIR
jgi:hypothetical protein